MLLKFFKEGEFRKLATWPQIAILFHSFKISPTVQMANDGFLILVSTVEMWLPPFLFMIFINLKNACPMPKQVMP